MDALLNDKRFAYIAKDPKFKRIPKTERKIKIDKRFQSMFNDKKFTVQYTIDKRGRPVNETSSENLKKYYDLSSSENDEEDEEEEEEQEQEQEQQRQKKSKQQKKKKSKERKKKGKEKNRIRRSKESDTEDDTNENEDNDLLDNCFSSNGELLRIKPKESNKNSEVEHTSESETESESDVDDATNAQTLKADLKESKKQLNVTRENESVKLTDKIKKKLKNLSVNYARGEGILMTDSSSEEESSEASESDEEEIEHNWGELDKEAETTDEITHRVAVCNMDWDRIRAVDLMVLFNSFLPSGGFINSVTIYPSEFGLQRMKEEEIKGPKELTEVDKEREIEDENDGEEGSEYHLEKLRQYQINRLKYYYAVVDFNSAETANKIYTECDGTEYESTSTKLDLRFIPNEMEFDRTPKEVCNEVPELAKYQPRLFATTALQQVKVELTWDETDPQRMEVTQKLNSGKLDQISENDLQAYLASDSSDNESADEKEKQKESQENKSDSEEEKNADPVEKYKALLKEIEEKEEAKQKKDVELEFTWGLGAKEKAEKLVQERLKKDENLTPFEQYLEKRKAKKKAKREERKKRNNADNDALDSEDSDMLDSNDSKVKNNKSSRRKKEAMENDGAASSDDEDEDEERRKAELELLLMDENDDGKQHFNMKKIEENATMTKSKQKRLSKKKNRQDQMVEDNFEVNVQDPRFNALFTSHHFNIDPADPHYRKTKGTEVLIKEKLKRRADNDIGQEIPAKELKTRPNTDLQALIKSVKKNSKYISKPIK